MKKVFLMAVLCIAFYNTYGQQVQATDIVPRSPEVANLGLYGNVDVSEYTGKPNISVPLYTVHSGDLTIPINLYYDATGIRVNQEASWVGLGWNLSTLYAITYIPQGGDDRLTNDSATPDEWQMLIDYINPDKVNPIVGHEEWTFSPVCDNMVGGDDHTPGTVIGSAQAGLGGIDQYSVNGPGFNFNFYLNRFSGEPLFFGEQSNFSVEVSGSSFILTDGDGVRYYFSKEEFGGNSVKASAWYLEQMISPDGHYIKFSYESATISTIPTLLEQNIYNANYDIAVALGYNRSFHVFANNHVSNLYLTKIETVTETVDFQLSGRTDIAGEAKKLDAMAVKGKFSDFEKTYRFDYDYFESSRVGGNYLIDVDYWGDENTWGGVTDLQLSSRLKLLGVSEETTEGSMNYAFDYNDDVLLPLKTSFAVDHWGYYNGVTNNKTFLPLLYSMLEYEPASRGYLSGVDLYSGAKRGASKDYLTAGMLSSITYPTKGRTAFEFEPNTFTNSTVLSAEDEGTYSSDVHLDLWDLNDGDETSLSADFTLEQDEDVVFMVHFHNNGGAVNYADLAGTAMNLISENPVARIYYWVPSSYADGTDYSETITNTLSLPAGSYHVTIGVPDDVGFQGYNPLAVATVEFKKYLTTDIPDDYTSIGGGLRIREIQDFDGNNELLGRKQYSYGSGKLMVLLNYSESRSVNYYSGDCSGTPFSPVTLDGNTAQALATSPVPAVVGYDKVTIEQLDENDLNNGRIEKRFYNSAELQVLFKNVVANDESVGKNGALKSIRYYQKDGNLIKLDSFNYQLAYLQKDWSNVVVEVRFGGNPCGCFAGTNGGSTFGYSIGVYPYVSYSTQLNQKMEWLYDDENSFQSLISYKYNSVNLKTSEQTIQASNGDLLTTSYYYPPDLKDEDAVFADMVSDHMINPVIEEKLMNGDVLVLDKITTYEQVGSVNYKPSQVTVSRNGQAYRTAVSYDAYDNANLVQYHTVDGIPYSIIWGYGGTLPVAIIKNVTYGNVYIWMTEELLDEIRDNVLTDDELREKLGVLRQDFPDAEVTIYTHDPILGVTSITDPTGITTYYEYDGFGRLYLIRDQYSNILKQYDYHYEGENGNGEDETDTSPVWEDTNNYRCVTDEYGYSTGTVEREQIDTNPESDTYNESQWIVYGINLSECRAAGGTMTINTTNITGSLFSIAYEDNSLELLTSDTYTVTFTATGGTYLSIIPETYTGEYYYEVAINGVLTYNGTSSMEVEWILGLYNDASIGIVIQTTATQTDPDWNDTGDTQCVTDTEGNNTGEVEKEQKDINQYSDTYGDFRWVSIGEDQNQCPIVTSGNLTFQLINELSGVVSITVPESEFELGAKGGESSSGEISFTSPVHLIISNLTLLAGYSYTVRVDGQLVASGDSPNGDDVVITNLELTEENIIVVTISESTGEETDTSPVWVNTGNTRCQKDDDGFNTGVIQEEQIDANPESSTYNQSQWVFLENNTMECPAPGGTITMNATNITGSLFSISYEGNSMELLTSDTYTVTFTATGGTDLSIIPETYTGEYYYEVAINGVLKYKGTSSMEVEWILGLYNNASIGIVIQTTATQTDPDWNDTGDTHCVTDSDGDYTGEVEKEQRDINQYSESYNTTRWVSIGEDLNLCPISQESMLTFKVVNNSSGSVSVIIGSNDLEIVALSGKTVSDEIDYKSSVNISIYNNTIIDGYTYTVKIGTKIVASGSEMDGDDTTISSISLSEGDIVTVTIDNY